MRQDKLAGKTADQLKAMYMASQLLLDFKIQSELIVQHDQFYDANILTYEKSYQGYGGQTYSWTENKLELRLPQDWYPSVYLQGLGSVRYNGKMTIALTAKPIPTTELRKDLQLDGVGLHEVDLIIWGERNDPMNKWRTIPEVAIEKRYMASMVTTDNAFCYAAISPNRAGATLKKRMMEDMKKQMGL